MVINSIAQIIAGVDEAGRGPLAGPVLAAAVILNPLKPIEGLADSKTLSPKKREYLFAKIKENCKAWSVGSAEVPEIDRINIFQATLLAMKRAILKLTITPDQILIDGTHCPKILEQNKFVMKAIIRGDSLIQEISAASIIAKVTRDLIMLEYDKTYPIYGFAAHKGYGTEKHLLALQKYGKCPIHRNSFAPVAAVGDAKLLQPCEKSHR